MRTLCRFGCCFAAVLVSFSAWAEVKWSYVGTTLTQTDAPEGATPWAFTVNASTGALTKNTVGTGPVLDLRRETLPAGVSAFTGEFPKIYNDNGCTTCEEVYLPEGITSLPASCFRKWTGLRVISLPAGLTTIGDNAFHSCSALTSIELPETVSKIGGSAFESCSNLKTIEPCFPNAVTSIGGGVVKLCSSLESEVRIGFATNSVTGEMMETTITAGNFIRSSSAKTVRFGPGVRSIPADFFILGYPTFVEYGCNMPEMFQNLKTYGAELTNVVVRYPGSFSLPSSGFNGLSKLREITWDGFFTYPLDSAVFQGWTDLQCRFIVPGNNAEWQRLMADSTMFKVWKDCSDADHDAYFAKYGNDAKVPAGITVSQGANRNLPRVFIVTTDVEVTDFPLTVKASPDLTITCTPEPSADGTYPKGTVVTVTAEPQGGARFVCWQGDVPPDCEHDRTIQVTMDDTKVLTALAESGTFTYDSSAKTISDGMTTINVTESAGVLTLGKISAHREDGVLDLSKPISGGKMITAIPASWNQYCSGWLTAVKLPETLTSIGDAAFRYCSKLVSVEPFLPNSVTYLGSSAFNGCGSLEGVLRVGYATNDNVMAATTLGTHALQSASKVAGVCYGPGVTSIPSTFYSNITVGFLDFGCNLSAMGAAINGNATGTKLTNVVVRCTGDFELVGAAFNQQTQLREITWHGWFTYPGNANVFNVWTALQCRFIVPRTNDSWNAFMADTTKMTPWADCSKADKDTYFARYGADAVWPAGISVAVSGGLPRTYIVRTLEGANEAQLNVRTTNAEMSTIALDPQPSPETGLYSVDTQVTVTLTLATGATFSGWEGDVAEEDRMKTTIVVTTDRSKTLLAKVKVQPEIADGSFAVSFPKGDSQPRISFALTGEEGAAYDATAEILWMTNGTDWVLGQTLTGLTNGQAVTSWLPQAFVRGSDLKLKVRVSAYSADDKTVESEWMTVEGDLPATWGKGGGAGVCHVLAGATGDGSGRDWFNALPAIPVAAAGLPAGAKEMWIATNVICTATVNLSLSKSLAFRGGFVGSEDMPEERLAGLKTVLDGEDAHETFKLTSSSASASFAFERIVFTRSLKSGLYLAGKDANVKSPLSIVDCDFVANGANGTVQGRGLYLSCAGDSSISNCTFRGNVCRTCSGTSSGEGFGAYLTGNGRVCIDNCQFLTNGYADVGYASAFGAAFTAHTKVVTVRNCEFRGNRSGVYGDGSIVYFAYTQIGGSAFTNCVFAGNELCETHVNGDRAGIVEMRLANSSQKAQTVDFCNCTFAYNIGGTGSGSSGINAVCGTVHAVNCIFFDNVTKGTATGADLSASSGDGTIKAEYCLFGGTNTTYVKTVGGGKLTLGEGIVTGDPKFVTRRRKFLALTTNVGADDLPQAGHYDPKFTEPFSPAVLAFDVHVRSCRSKAVDTGDPAAEYGNEPKPNGGRLNLGAYGNTPEAKQSAGGSVLIVR